MHRSDRREIRSFVPPPINAIPFKIDVEVFQVIVDSLSHFEVDAKCLSQTDVLRPCVTDKHFRVYGTGLGWEVGAGRPGLPKGSDAGEASPDPARFTARTLTVSSWPTG
jgi:hypothetical protein